MKHSTSVFNESKKKKVTVFGKNIFHAPKFSKTSILGFVALLIAFGIKMAFFGMKME